MPVKKGPPVMPEGLLAVTPSGVPAVTPEGGLLEAQLHALLGYQLAQASVATSKVFQKVVGGPEKLRPVEYTLLSLIAGNPEVSSAKLAKALAVTKPNITMWVDRLESRGLVERRPSTTDMRTTDLRATPLGIKTSKAASLKLASAEAKTFHALSPEQTRELIALLHLLARHRQTPVSA